MQYQLPDRPSNLDGVSMVHIVFALFNIVHFPPFAPPLLSAHKDFLSHKGLNNSPMKNPFKASVTVLKIASPPYFFFLNRTKESVNLLIIDSIFTGISLLII
jgi:hypothetical protein